MLHNKHPRTEICRRVAGHAIKSQTSSVINRSANEREHWTYNYNSVPVSDGRISSNVKVLAVTETGTG